MTEVERVARAMEAEYDGTMESLARWHFAAVRRARRRAVLWCGVGGVKRHNVMGVWDSRVMTEAEIHGTEYRLARVVLVPRRKGGKRG